MKKKDNLFILDETKSTVVNLLFPSLKGGYHENTSKNSCILPAQGYWNLAPTNFVT